MHQLQFGVNDVFVVGEYHFKIIEVSADNVRIGLSSNGNSGKRQEIVLSCDSLALAGSPTKDDESLPRFAS
ncbi:MAG: hypothetical protein R3C01_11480 [Planctomycetaceae bacterium]